MRLFKIAVVGFCFVGSLTSFAQENKMTVEERSEKMTAKMSEKLELTEEQETKLTAVNLDFIQSTKKIKQDESISKDIKKSQISDLRESYNTEVKSFLTEEQYAEYKEVMEAKQAKRQENKGKSLEEKVQAKTDKMAEQLELDDEQKTKVYDLNLKVAKKIKAVKENEEFSDEKKKEFIKGNKKDYKTVLSSILTVEQMAKFEELKAERKAKKENKKIEE